MWAVREDLDITLGGLTIYNELWKMWEGKRKIEILSLRPKRWIAGGQTQASVSASSTGPGMAGSPVRSVPSAMSKAGSP